LVFLNKLNFRKKRFAVLLILLQISSLSFLGKISAEEEKQFVLWTFADIQPRDDDEREDFEITVEDVIKNKLQVDAAVCAGDMVQLSSAQNPDEEWKWFYKTIEPLAIKNFYEIIGNHDARNIPAYFKYTKKPMHYAVRFGNLLLILLSDEKNSSGTDISDNAFLWWKKLVEDNQSDIIITITHSHLGGTGFAYNYPSYRNVVDSERFTEVLKKQRVDYWLFGHTHVPSTLKGKNRKINSLGGTHFINIAAIREDYFLSFAESKFFYFTPGSDVLTIKTRNHRKNKFMSSIEIREKMKTAFVYDGSGPEFIEFRDNDK